MPVPSDIDTLSTTAAENDPAGTEDTFPALDNHLRQVYAFLAVLRAQANAFDAGTGLAPLAGATFTGAVSVTTVDLTDAATIATNAGLANTFRVTLGSNRVLGNPTALRDGGVYRWLIKQDGTGSRTLSFASFFAWPGGTAPTLTTTPGAVDMVTAVYDAADAKLYSRADLNVS